MLSPALFSSFTKVILSFVISSLIVCIYLPSGYSFTPVIFQNCLALEIIPSSSSLLIAKADGTVAAYNVTDYAHGVGSEKDNNYILSCGAAQKKLGSGEFYLTVNAGQLYDYIIPFDPYTKKGENVSASLCDTLFRYNNYTLVSYYLYSSVRPDAPEYNGSAKVVLKWNRSTTPYLGGCNVYLSDDDRFTITRWGMYEKNYSKKGSCCFNTTAEAHHTWLFGGWGKPFTITAHQIKGSYVYLSNAVFANYIGTERYSIKGKVNDLYLNSNGVFSCSWAIRVNYGDKDLESETYLSDSCDLDFKFALPIKPKTATFTCTVTDTSKTFWPSTTDQTKSVTVKVKSIPKTALKLIYRK